MRVFVAAVGTDIGKTWLSAAWTRRWRRQGLRPLALKPVLSGFDPAAPEASDAGLLLDALGEKPTPKALDAIAPWRFAAPLSPDMAAAREGRALRLDDIVAFCRARMAAHDGPVLIEGVGGVMVPLNRDATTLDWLAALGVPAVLVTGSYLGALSHCLTAVAALRGAGIAPRAALVNESPGSTVDLDETAASLAPRLGASCPILRLRRDPAAAELDAVLEGLERAIA